MPVKGICQLAHTFYQTQVLPPFQEAKRQRQYAALFWEKVQDQSPHPSSLCGRVAHEVAGTVLMIPVINKVIYAVMCLFAWDFGGKFEHAIRHHKHDVVEQFLHLGFNSNQLGKNGAPLLFTAYESRNQRAIIALFAKEVNPRALDLNGKTLFDCLYEAGKWEELTALMQIEEVDFNILNDSGYALLHRACQDRKLDLARRLIDRGADPLLFSENERDSPVLLAYNNRCYEFVYELVRSKKIDVNAKVSASQTLFDCAWENRIQDGGKSACMFLKYGAAPSLKHYNHLDVLKLAYKKDRKIIWEKMVEAGWDINTRSSREETLLHYIQERGDWASFRKLIENGAHISTLDPSGERLISWKALKKEPQFWETVIGCSSEYSKWFGLNLRGLLSCFGLTPRNSVYASVFHFCTIKEKNPLEILLFFGDEEAIRTLSTQVSFHDFCHFYTDLKKKFPRFDTSWCWDALFEVNLDHFNLFHPVAADIEQLPPAPEGIDLHTLEALFDQINFTNSEAPYYKGEKQRTFDRRIWPASHFRKGLKLMINKIELRLEDVAAPIEEIDPQLFKTYYDELELYLRHVVHWLQNPELAGDEKGTALIDMGYIGYFCTDKWKELFYKIYCNLSGTNEPNISIQAQTMKIFGDSRLMIAETIGRELNTRNEAYDTHGFHEVMYHLKDIRAIPGPTYRERDRYVHLELEKVKDRFDAIYCQPSFLLEQVNVYERSSAQYRYMMTDWFKDYSTHWMDGPFRKWEKTIGKATNTRIEGFFEDGYGKLRSFQDIPIATTIKQTKTLFEKQGRDWTPGAFLQYLREQEFAEIIRPEDLQYERIPLATAEFLRDQGYLKYKNDQSFQNSFDNFRS